MAEKKTVKVRFDPSLAGLQKKDFNDTMFSPEAAAKLRQQLQRLGVDGHIEFDSSSAEAKACRDGVPADYRISFDRVVTEEEKSE